MAIISSSGPIDGTNDGDTIIGSNGPDSIRGLGGNDNILAQGGDDTVDGGGGGDTISGGAGDDSLDGENGNDNIFGGAGNDQIFGGSNNDNLSGDSGDDTLTGGEGGADRFLFDPSNDLEGNDTITDFEVGSDRIVLQAADILRADPDLPAADGDPTAFAEQLDASNEWNVLPSSDGDIIIQHPGGSIEFVGVPFSNVTDTFAELDELNAAEIVGLKVGNDGNNSSTGDQNDEVFYGLGGNDTIDARGGADIVFGGDGDDTLTGGSGNDTLSGGEGLDEFRFDPSNENEGLDVITDFNVEEDTIVLRAKDVLAADPDLPAAADPDDELTVEDFDASDNWDVENVNGNVGISHPGGAIVLDGVAFGDGTDSFGDLNEAGALVLV